MTETDPTQRIAALVATSAELLHGIRSRSEAARIAAELLRLNAAVRDRARPVVGPFDQPGDFAAVLLRNADPANGG